jgi:hypothetical protein
MKTEIKEVYKCDFCRKLYQRKHAAIYHEKMCNRNPDNFRSCHSCNGLEKKEVIIYSGIDDYITGEPINISRDFLFCKKRQIFLYTPQNEIKGNHNHIDAEGNSFENYPMAKECTYWSNGVLN